MEPQSCKELVQNFIDKLFQFRTYMIEECLPKCLSDGFNHYQEMVKSEDFKKSSPMQKIKVQKKFQYLRQFRDLKCYAWNGSKYDVNCLVGPMLNIFSRNKTGFRSMSCIKKANSYMQISYMGVIFRDMMNFSAPISLDNFAKSCGITEISKTIFPYELYTEVSELENATEFPHYKNFISSLKSSFTDNYLKEFADVIEEKFCKKEWLEVSQIFEYYNIEYDEILFQFEGHELTYGYEGALILSKILISYYIFLINYSRTISSYFTENI